MNIKKFVDALTSDEVKFLKECIEAKEGKALQEKHRKALSAAMLTCAFVDFQGMKLRVVGEEREYGCWQGNKHTFTLENGSKIVFPLEDK